MFVGRKCPKAWAKSLPIEKIVMICSLFHIGIEKIVEIDDGNSSDDEKNQLLRDLSGSLENLTYSQLQFVKKFVQDIVPYV